MNTTDVCQWNGRKDTEIVGTLESLEWMNKGSYKYNLETPSNGQAHKTKGREQGEPTVLKNTSSHKG